MKSTIPAPPSRRSSGASSTLWVGPRGVWSKEELAGVIDVLVVDEAGQMSLANVLACAQSATNLVLLGDPPAARAAAKGITPRRLRAVRAGAPARRPRHHAGG